jgi:hypothetical protein
MIHPPVPTKLCSSSGLALWVIPSAVAASLAALIGYSALAANKDEVQAPADPSAVPDMNPEMRQRANEAVAETKRRLRDLRDRLAAANAAPEILDKLDRKLAEVAAKEIK